MKNLPRLNEVDSDIIKRYFSRACLAVVAVTLILIIVKVLLLLLVIPKQSSLNRYIFEAELLDGGLEALVCYEGYHELDYDFILDMDDKRFKEVRLKGNKSVNTDNALACMSYSPDKHSLDTKLKEAMDRKNGEKVTAIVGGAYTYGVGVRSGKAFPDILAEMYEAKESGNSRVFNFGVASGGLEEIYTSSFAKALESGADEIIYVLKLDDIPTQSIAFSSQKRPFDMTVKINPYEYFRGNALMKYLRAVYFGMYSGELRREWYESVYGPENFDGRERFDELLLKMQEECTLANVDFRISIFPLITEKRSSYPYEEIHGFIAETVDGLGIQYYDLTETVYSIPPKKRMVHPIDYSPSALTHEKVAKSLFENFM